MMDKKSAPDRQLQQERNIQSPFHAKGSDTEENRNILNRSLTQKTTIHHSNPALSFRNHIAEKNLLNSQKDLNRYFSEINGRLFHGGSYHGRIVVCEDCAIVDFSFLNKWLSNLKLLKAMTWQLGTLGKRFVSVERTSDITPKDYHTMTKTEVLGRLVYSGFKITKTEEINNVLYFESVKVGRPDPSEIKASSLFYKARRVGKGGKRIEVYKLRTMYPYAEFLQSYVYEQNNLDVGGKFKGDFRISKRGKFLRKYFLDELPMIWNLIRGDIKLVGVRPISRHYLSLYEERFQSIRNNAKPGLLPPYYVDFPDTIEKIQQSESRYLEKYQHNPWLTDLSYFFHISYNIIFGRKRSK